MNDNEQHTTMKTINSVMVTDNCPPEVEALIEPLLRTLGKSKADLAYCALAAFCVAGALFAALEYDDDDIRGLEGLIHYLVKENREFNAGACAPEPH